MSKHSTSALTMRDALYEAPGPKMRAKIRVGTAISLVAVVALIALVLQRFYVTGQLSVHYWYFFTHLTTWKFLLAGFEGTVRSRSPLAPSRWYWVWPHARPYQRH